MKYIAAVMLATAALLAPAKADNITLFSTNQFTSTLSLIGVPPPGNEPRNTPCLICASNQPQQPANFGDNNYMQSGNETSFIEFSSATVGARLAQDTLGTGYDLSFLKAFLLSQAAAGFDVGIDVNTGTGQGPEVLERFAVLDLTSHTILSQFIGPAPLATTNNGSGFPDFILTGFDIDRNDINLGDQLLFFARWSNASDGGEQFFLVPQAVPGPIVGAGIPGLIAACVGLWGMAWRRRWLRRNGLAAA